MRTNKAEQASDLKSDSHPNQNVRRWTSTGRAALLAASLGLLIAACGSTASSSAPTTAASSSPSTTAAALTNVTVQVYPGAIWSVPVYAAQQEGFFAKHGISASFVPANTGPAAIAALASGSVDTISVSPEVILGAIAHGLTAKVWASTMGVPWEILLSKKEAAKGFTYPQDLHVLNGLTVGVPAIPSAGEAMLNASLLEAGMQTTAVHVVSVGIGAPALAALETGQIDALVIQQPVSDEAVTQAGAQVLMNPFKGQLPHTLSGPYLGQWSLTSYLTAHAGTVKRMQAALAEAKSWLSDPANNKAVSGFLSTLYGVQGLNYSQIAREDQPLWMTTYTQGALKAYDAYDARYGFLPAPISTTGLLWQGS